MTFDKTKAMRNAEKYLSQGKIRSAIGEYEQVVKHDARDFGTMNMLGDLHTKNLDVKAAVKYYTCVAEHYAKQGFAQKAIAVYNKISKLDPHSIDVSQRLAELYKVKGSLKDARAHYERVAEYFQRQGQKIEALGIWKEIALLDSTNTDVYISIADSYLEEGQTDEAFDAYVEVGTRFAKTEDHESAADSFLKAINIKRDDARALAGFVRAQFELGRARQAAEKLSELLAEFPHSREIRFLLIDCLIEAKELAEAEKAVIKLVEMEPANYPKFLELSHIYLSVEDINSATRILTMSSEHMLVGGQADEFRLLVDQILLRNPEQLDALRLLARYCSWQRDEDALCKSLVKLAEVAKGADSVDDERFALMQLTMIVPHEVAYTERLRTINELHGFEQVDDQENLFDSRFLKGQSNHKDPVELDEPVDGIIADNEFENGEPFVEGAVTVVDTFSDPGTGFAFAGTVIEIDESRVEQNGSANGSMTADGALRLQKEIDSIRFYIDNGYIELAEKSIFELQAEFGNRRELNEVAAELGLLASYTDPDQVGPEVMIAVGNTSLNGTRTFDIDDLRNELGIEETDPIDNSDYETHFNTAVAYQEMGLIENSIKEFQEAASLVKPNDGTRRFFSCANLLGHCFMEQKMPNLALKWFQRTLETADLTDEEKQGIWYELAGAYEAEGDHENAGRYFEQVYAENVNFRDVSERVKNVSVHR
jgi:tetratricopeptide (TPR) repeat protein